MRPAAGSDLASWVHDGDAFLRRLRLAIALGPRREVRYRQPAAAAPAERSPPAPGGPGAEPGRGRAPR